VTDARLGLLFIVAVCVECDGPTPPSASSRSTTDRLDDITGAQVHVVYVLPSDGQDRQLDTNGTLRNTVGSWQTWLSGQTAGRVWRLDTYREGPHGARC